MAKPFKKSKRERERLLKRRREEKMERRRFRRDLRARGIDPDTVDKDGQPLPEQGTDGQQQEPAGPITGEDSKLSDEVNDPSPTGSGQPGPLTSPE